MHTNVTVVTDLNKINLLYVSYIVKIHVHECMGEGEGGAKYRILFASALIAAT